VSGLTAIKQPVQSFSRTETRELSFANSERPAVSAAAADNFDLIIEWLLIGMLVFAPAAFGAVEAWSKEVVVVLSGLLAVVFALKLLCRPDLRIVRSWSYLLIGLFILIAVLQLMPMPAWLVKVLSPNTLRLKNELLSVLPGAAVPASTATLTFYTNATKNDLRLVLAVASVFIVVLNVFRRPQQIKRLLGAIALIGGLFALIAMAQELFGNDKVYWFVTYRRHGVFSGPFANHSHYGQFMNLSIGAALGLLMVRIHEDFAARKITAPAVFQYLSSRSARMVWVLCAIVVLGAVTIFASLTRGGMAAMLLAGAFTTIIVTSRRTLRGRGWIMGLTALTALVCVLYIGFDAIYDRVATLRNLDPYQDRLQILKDLTAVFRRFPFLGTGLGTHRAVYPMFDTSTIAAIATHAENEYAQVVEETGLAGLLPLVVFGGMVWVAYARCVRREHSPIHSAAYGLGFGLLAILIQSLSDFGQHLPANAMLSAVFCALLLGLGAKKSGEQNQTGGVASRRGLILRRMASVVVVLVVFLALYRDAHRMRVAEAHWRNVQQLEKMLAAKNWQGSADQYEELISRASAAVACQPDNAEYRYWLNVYKWRSITATAPVDAETGLRVFPDDMKPAVRAVVAGLYEACNLCPTYGPAYSVAGQIEKFVLNEPSGDALIAQGFRIAPCDPIACFVAGYLDVTEDRINQAVEKFQRAIALDGSLFRDVVEIYVRYLSRPTLALQAAGDDPGRLYHVATVFEQMQYQDLAERAWARAKEVLRAETEQSTAPAWVFARLADVCKKQNDTAAAIANYRSALALDYGQVDWRLELARLLAQTGNIPEAIDQARICLRIRPQMTAAKELVADLSVQSGLFNR